MGDELDDETWKAIASWDLSAATRSDGGHPLAVHLATLTKQIIDEFPDPPESLRSPAAEVLRQLKTGGTTPEDLDLASCHWPPNRWRATSPSSSCALRATCPRRRPTRSSSSLHRANKRSPVSSCTTSARSSRATRRTNDWWWGRLDSVRVLLDVVLDREAMQTLRDSGFLAANGFTTADHSVEDVKNWLLEQRQRQLLDERGGPQPDFEKATSSDQFKAWATDERRLSALLGSRTLTSTTIRGVITASKMLRLGLGRVAQVALTVVRPLLLALAGVVLAGRRGCCGDCLDRLCDGCSPRQQHHG